MSRKQGAISKGQEDSSSRPIFEVTLVYFRLIDLLLTAQVLHQLIDPIMYKVLYIPYAKSLPKLQMESDSPTSVAQHLFVVLQNRGAGIRGTLYHSKVVSSWVGAVFTQKLASTTLAVASKHLHLFQRTKIPLQGTKKYPYPITAGTFF